MKDWLYRADADGEFVEGLDQCIHVDAQMLLVHETYSSPEISSLKLYKLMKLNRLIWWESLWLYKILLSLKPPDLLIYVVINSQFLTFCVCDTF